MSDENFDQYIKVKNVNIKSLGEPTLIRLRYNDATFAHIEVKPSFDGKGVSLQVLQIDESNQRNMVKWVPNLELSPEEEE